MSIIVDSFTSHLPEIKSFVEAVRQYCKMIESIDNQKELCIFFASGCGVNCSSLYVCVRSSRNFTAIQIYQSHF